MRRYRQLIWNESGASTLKNFGLTTESEAPEGIFYRSGETRFPVFPSGGTTSGAHTQLSWTVDDIETEVAALKSRGVIFEEYDMPSLAIVKQGL